MPVESWTRPEDVPTLAAEAIVQIDAVLTRLDAAARDAFWASIAKCYNTPYNDPVPRRLLRVDALAGTDGLPAEDEPPVADFPSLAAIPHPPAFASEQHAG
ncbi:hypothetical protein [uncultured Methylobacterium sp.]|uniref:hypothetical protein n=1 Tax=uncultured Methylobacterium sp. TaxID=157278 RepID=UPI0035CA70FD